MSEDDRGMISIAVVGLGVLFPGSADAQGFWRDILAGRDLITDVPPSHWLVEDYYDPNPSASDKTYSKRGAFLPVIDFDPIEFGVPPSILPATDPSQILALVAAQKVLEDACQGQFASLNRERVSVLLGVTSGQQLLNSMVSRLQRPVWIKALRESGIPEPEAQAICDRIAGSYVGWQESSFPGLLGNLVAGRIANRFDLHGTNAVIDAACASSLGALSMAISELQLGRSDMVISGGVDTMNDIFMYMCFSKTPALSPTGDCRPFSDNADGTLLGEGICMMALKRLSDAERDGDKIYAVIRGIGSSSDGRSKSVYAPADEGQAKALRRAYDMAGYGPDTVELVEAHGTGTKAGDTAEFEALRRVFSESGRSDKQWCALGTVKSQIGHTKAAAGAAGLFKAIMALHHKVLPPTIKIERPNSTLEFENSAFYLNTQARPWIHDPLHQRRASVSSFGFGGSNFHVALEEYVPKNGKGHSARRFRAFPTELVLLSAPGAAELVQRCEKIIANPGDILRVARDSQKDFDVAHHARLAVVAANATELADKLRQAVAAIAKEPNQSFATQTRIAYAVGIPKTGGAAFLFPGQGSQYLGMGGDLAMSMDAAREAWDDAALLKFDGESAHHVVFPPPAFDDHTREEQIRKLTDTRWAQVALGVHSVALLKLLNLAGVRADCVGGHSFGEITALHAAGAFDEATLLRIARRRGELMHEASAISGAMSAVWSSIDDLRAVLSQLDAEVVVANHNAPGQCVMSGAVEAIERVEQALTTKGVINKRLPVATAFHSPLVAASVAPFLEYLGGMKIKAPSIDVYSADGTLYPRDTRSIQERLGMQIAQPVRFVDQVEAMYARGVRIFIEVGPGNVLTELVGSILKGRDHRAINLDRKGVHGVTSLQGALGQLSVAGVALDLEFLWAGYVPASEKPAKKPALALSVSGTSYGKLYPPAGGARDLPPPNPPRQVPPAVPEPVTAAPATPQTSATPQVPAMPQIPAAPQVLATPQINDAWVQAYQETQCHTAEVHAAYQRAMAESHIAFLKTAEASLASLNALFAGEQPARTKAPASAAQPSPAFEPIAFPPAPPVSKSAEPIPMHIPATTPIAAEAPTPPAPAVDLEGLLLNIVAEKTGYPKEMLGAHMELESDLGIDSIKRVEILSAMRERAPGLREVKMTELGTLRTLGQIAEYMRVQVNGTPIIKSGTNGSSPSAVMAHAADFESLLMTIVAEKTGYPKEMLGTHMELESDLGIDSIKRVEILSAMRERASDLREVKMTELGTLRTLGQIVEYMRVQGNGTPSARPSNNGTTAAFEETGKKSAVQRFALRAVVASPAGMTIAGLLAAERMVITDDGDGLADTVAARLKEHGLHASVVSNVPADADAVIFLGGMRSVSNVADAIAVNHEAFRAARAVAARFSSEHRGVFVTVQDTGGDLGLSGRDSTRAWLGGISALARTAALEWPGASVKAIDCERGGRSLEAIADSICAELFQGGPAGEVGLRADGSRIVPACVPAPEQPAPSVYIRPESVVIVSGGARGITAAAIVALARAYRCRIALLGRTPLDPEPVAIAGIHDENALNHALIELARAEGRAVAPVEISAQRSRLLAAREVRATLDAVSSAGSLVRYITVDVLDAAAVASAVTQVRREWGPITAIVHGAGVLADKRIVDKTEEQFNRVFDTKVAGLRSLLAATAGDPLNLIALFSSVVSSAGNPGQCDYAAANQVINLVACAEQAQRGERCVVRSLAWGPWDAGMVTPALKAHFQGMGVELIPRELGAKAFVDEMSRTGDPVVLLTMGANNHHLPIAGKSPQSRAEIRVDAHAYPYLGDHRVAGTPVVPLVFALEWMLRGARTYCPDFARVSVRNVRVLSGIKLSAFENGGDTLIVNCRQGANNGDSEILAELRSGSGTLHYTAAIQMSKEPAAHAIAPAPPDLEPSPLEVIYDGHVLFHRERFQMVRSVEGISPAGIAGTLVGALELDWPAGPWCIDPAVLDGGLQLAGLWTKHVLGGAALPMAVKEVRIYRSGIADGFVRCVVHARGVHDMHTLSDISFAGSGGTLIAEMLGVEAVLRPDEAKLASTARLIQI